MANKWNIQIHDRGILESTIGAAVLDKLRNHKTKMSELYVLRGGQDPKTKRVLEEYDERLASLDFSKSEAAASIRRDQHKDFDHAFSQLSLSHRELTLLERALGSARLTRAEGNAQSALDSYKALGGDNPHTLDALKKIAEK